MPQLKALKFVLGGIESVAEVANLPALETLAFTMVRGLSDLGDLRRFPSLEQLLIQDQPRLKALQLGAENRALRHLWFYNCPNLKHIAGLNGVPRLISIRAVKTGLQLGALTHPRSLTHLALYSGKPKSEAAERSAIEALGLVPEAHPDMPFFYR